MAAANVEAGGYVAGACAPTEAARAGGWLEAEAAARVVLAKLNKESMEVGDNAPSLHNFSIFDGVDVTARDAVMQHVKTNIVLDRAVGSMLAMTIGDAIGHFFEFVPIGTEGSRLYVDGLQIEGQKNKFKLEPGQWTDDTSMSLCMADSLLVCEGYNGTDIRVRFWNWWNRCYDNAFRYDKTRNHSVGLGGNIRMSLLDIESDYPDPRYAAQTEDAGNGSLMRLAPIPIFFHTDMELAIQASVESSYTTHPGPIAADACAFLGFVIVSALNRGPSAPSDSVAQFLDTCVAQYLQRPEVKDQTLMVRLLKSAEPEGSKERCWNWRDPSGPFLLETVEARGRRYNGYPVDKAYFGSFSMDGLAMALHSVYHTTSAMGALEKCINFLGDADSTAAICGQIAGAFYGASALDELCTGLVNDWDHGEIALRAALVTILGATRSPDMGGHQLLGLPTADVRDEATQKAEELLQRGKASWSAKEYEQARLLYEEAGKANPNDLEVYIKECSLWFAMGEEHHDKVLELCQEALRRRKDIVAVSPCGASYDKVAAVYRQLGLVHAHRHEFGLARQAYVTSLTLDNQQQTRIELRSLESREKNAAKEAAVKARLASAAESLAKAATAEAVLVDT